MILVAYRHGLRVVELCSLTWDQIDFSQGMLHVRPVKNGIASVQQIGREETRMLRALKREESAGRYVFMATGERGGEGEPELDRRSASSHPRAIMWARNCCTRLPNGSAPWHGAVGVLRTTAGELAS
jgi:integrase